jgi:hypothetical protein
VVAVVVAVGMARWLGYGDEGYRVYMVLVLLL